MTDTSNPRGECASPVPGVWVLLVDDDAGIRRLIEEFAAHVGWELVSTPDAQTVLSWIEGGVAPFDLLIVDVAMPGMDGLALVRAVRAPPRGSGRRCLRSPGSRCRMSAP